ncbi:MAG: 16S rRNA (adenine(1518)-N(6)/adenine(1519)-N(6))-dimethyltransferase RsmA [Dehalococcoidia bacterium]
MTAPNSSRLRPRKALGQHFLVDHHILGRIVAAAELSPEDVVLEVGPGSGFLTRQLVRHAGSVVVIEKDARLAAALPGQLGFPENLRVVEADAREVDIPDMLGGDISYKVVANLPYYAANPIVRRFLESEPKPQLLVVMVQQEVARSMTAAPGSMTLLSVATQFYAISKMVCNVPPRAFRPPPKVTSGVVRLEVRPAPAVPVGNTDAFFDVVRAGFSAPRKQLRNSLSQGLAVSGESVGQLLDSLAIDGRRRAETLTVEEWGQIYRAWEREQDVASPGLR